MNKQEIIPNQLGFIVKQFKLHWMDGRTEIISGINIADAFTKAGYGFGAIRALDYYENIS